MAAHEEMWLGQQTYLHRLNASFFFFQYMWKVPGRAVCLMRENWSLRLVMERVWACQLESKKPSWLWSRKRRPSSPWNPSMFALMLSAVLLCGDVDCNWGSNCIISFLQLSIDSGNPTLLEIVRKHYFCQGCCRWMDSRPVFKSALALQPGTKAKSLVFKQTQLDKTVSPEDNRARDDLYSCFMWKWSKRYWICKFSRL